MAAQILIFNHLNFASGLIYYFRSRSSMVCLIRSHTSQFTPCLSVYDWKILLVKLYR